MANNRWRQRLKACKQLIDYKYKKALDKSYVEKFVKYFERFIIMGEGR